MPNQPQNQPQNLYEKTYCFAGLCVTVRSIYPAVHTLCAGYAATAAPVAQLTTTQADIAQEREPTRRAAELEHRPPPQYSDAYLETIAVYRKLGELLPAYGGAVFHGSAVAVDGKGYLFTAKSGTGKSTHTALWRQLFGPRAVMVNDDKPILRAEHGGITVYGTPWAGKHNLGSNIGVPLAGLCVLERGAQNSITPITKAQAYPLLLQQIYRPQGRTALAQTMALLDTLTATVPLYRLTCNMEPDAARVAYTGMSGQTL